jgi:hypothetical protein
LLRLAVAPTSRCVNIESVSGGPVVGSAKMLCRAASPESVETCI